MQLTIQEIVMSVVIGLALLIAGGSMMVSDSLFVSWVFVAVGLTFLFVDRAFVAFATFVFFVTLVFSHVTGMPSFVYLVYVFGTFSFIFFVTIYMILADTWFEKVLLTGTWTGLWGSGAFLFAREDTMGEGFVLCMLSLVACLLILVLDSRVPKH